MIRKMSSLLFALVVGFFVTATAAETTEAEAPSDAEAKPEPSADQWLVAIEEELGVKLESVYQDYLEEKGSLRQTLIVLRDLQQEQ